jgi:hypothetical protein
LRLLRAGFDELGEAIAAFRHVTFLSEMAEALGRAGQIADGLVTIDEALARSERTEERWPIAEFLHVKGELLLSQSVQGAAVAAEDHFRQALDWARRQGALSWELRAATSLARLLRDRGGSAHALALLQPAYDRFTEGFDTADLKAAKTPSRSPPIMSAVVSAFVWHGPHAATRAIAEFNAASGGQSPTHNLPPRRDRLERAGCHPWAASHRCVLWDSVRRGRSSG